MLYRTLLHKITKYANQLITHDVYNKSLVSYSRVTKKRLPKPPVPPLTSTLSRYVEYVSVIGNDNQLRRTKTLVDEFAKDAGAKLQAKLEAVAEKEDNWMTKYWINDMYLNNRICLPINSNPGYIFPVHSFATQADMIRYAALLIVGSYNFKDMVDSRTIPGDKATGKQGGQSMCMDQYWRMFSSYREAAKNRDILFTNVLDTDKATRNEHVVVMCRDQAFTIKTVVNGERLPQIELEAQLNKVLAEADKCESVPYPVSLITSANRDSGAEALTLLLQDHDNVDNYEKMKTCTFVLCLDQPVWPENGLNKSREYMAHLMLHGCGTSLNSCNRWFDKTNQFIVSPDGVCGMNFEHSVAEGIVLISLVEYVLKFIESESGKRAIGDARLHLEPERIIWNISPELEAKLRDLQSEFDKIINDVDLVVMTYEGYGKDFLKNKKLSPDAFIQLSLQLTYYRLHKYLVSTYESASTRRFRYGRVDNIRSATPESFAWVRIMQDPAASDTIKHEAFRTAIDKQTKVMVENVNGLGIDNHLVALREIAKESDQTLPEVFQDEMFVEAFRFPLSTSQVPTTVKDTFVCYGPVVPDGYGCCYNPSNEDIIFIVSTFKSCTVNSAEKYAGMLRKTLDDLKIFLSN